MQIKTLPAADRPKLRIENVRGTLRIRVGQAGQVQARAADGTELVLVEQNGAIQLNAAGDCQLLLPPEATVEAQTIGGDLSVMDLAGELLVRNVGGSLRMRRIGSAAVETVGGELVARAQRRAAPRRDFRIDLPSAGVRSEPSDDERLMILRMVEQRKISVDEAESLLQALES